MPIQQKIHLIWTDYYSGYNVYVIALTGVQTSIARVRVHHANHCTTKAHINYVICLSNNYDTVISI